jgi:hypothetical protein
VPVEINPELISQARRIVLIRGDAFVVATPNRPDPEEQLHVVMIAIHEINPPNACVSDRRQRETGSGIRARVEAASCSLDAMVGWSPS